MAEPLWDGAWVADELGVRLRGEGLRDLVGLALRRNPRRAHLLVSHVLGKHVPVEPSRLFAAAADLAARVRAAAGGPFAVLGYAETATGLGHAVAAALGSDAYLHSTRRPVADVAHYGAFEEEHSHATSHLLLADRPGPLDAPALVLVDDELSTGRTVRNTIAGLRRTVTHERYLAAALVDVTGGSAGTPSVALASGTIELPPDVLARAAELIARVAEPPVATVPRGKVVAVEAAWPAGVREGGRHGFGRTDEYRARAAAGAVAERLGGEPDREPELAKT
jgi:orotate phosphoribosyltransferase-like protein